MAGVAFTACLLAACTPLAPRVFLFVAYLLYFCYFTQMFADATLSGHGSVLIPSVLFLLSFLMCCYCLCKTRRALQNPELGRVPADVALSDRPGLSAVTGNPSGSLKFACQPAPTSFGRLDETDDDEPPKPVDPFHDGISWRK